MVAFPSPQKAPQFRISKKSPFLRRQKDTSGVLPVSANCKPTPIKWPKEVNATVLEPVRQAGRINAQEVLMILTIELDQEEDGRWIAEVVDIPGALAYGTTPEQAKSKAKAIALRVLADQLEHGEATDDLSSISFAAA